MRGRRKVALFYFVLKLWADAGRRSVLRDRAMSPQALLGNSGNPPLQVGGSSQDSADLADRAQAIVKARAAGSGR